MIKKLVPLFIAFLILDLPTNVFTQSKSEYIFVKNIEATGNNIPNEVNMVNSISGVDEADNIYFDGTFTNTIILGNQNYNCSNDRDGYFGKCDSNGNIIWSNHLDASVDVSVFSNLLDNQLYLYGGFKGQVIIGSDTFSNINSQHVDLIISKLDSDGNFIWTKSFGGDYHDLIFCVAKDADGSLLFGGYYSEEIVIDDTILSSPNGITKECLLLKYSIDGDLLWAKDFKGPNSDLIYLCETDENSNIYVTGNCFEGIDIDTIPLYEEWLQYYLAKLDHNGNAIWAFQYGSGSFYSDNYIVDLKYDSNGSLYLFGFFHDSLHVKEHVVYSTAGYYDAYILKLSIDGEIEWLKTYTGNGEEYAGGLAIDESGRIYITGYFTGDITLGDTTYEVNCDIDIFLAEIDENGTVLWSEQTSGTQSTSYLYSNSIISKDNDLYIGGGFREDAFFNPFLLESEDAFNGYIAKYENLHVGIEDQPMIDEMQDIFIYPNPVSTTLNIEISDKFKSPCKIAIFDFHGIEVISEGIFYNNSLTFDISDFQKGVYILKVSDDKNSIVKRFLKI